MRTAKNKDVKPSKKIGLCFIKYLTVTFSVGSPVEINNRVSDSHDSVSVEAFASQAATRAVLVGTLVMISKFF